MNRKTISGFITTSLAVTLAAVLTSCGKQGGLPQGTNEFPVETVTTSETVLDQIYPAVIKGKQDIEIRPQVQGFITRLCVDEGATVKAGQPLFLINDVTYQAALNQAIASQATAQAALATAELTYNNKKDLFNENIIGDFELQAATNALEQAKAQLQAAKAAVRSARQNLSYCTVTSPANGVVGTIPYRVGSLVSSASQQPLTVVSNIEDMHVYFSMTEAQLLTMSRNTPANELMQSFPEVQLQLADGSIYEENGHVNTISGVIDENTGSVTVRADFANKNHLLKSGGMGNIIIKQNYENVLIIPKAATIEVQDKIFVYLVGNDNKVKYTDIEVNPKDDGTNYIVTKGLAANDRYVTKGLTKLTDGMEITPVSEAAYEKAIQDAQARGKEQNVEKAFK